MSVVTLEAAKRYLVVIHNSDDERIQDLIDDAEDECVQYIDRPLPRAGEDCPDECDTGATTVSPVSDGVDLPRSLRRGILLIVQAAYEGKDAAEMMKMREAAEICWAPFRCKLGA